MPSILSPEKRRLRLTGPVALAAIAAVLVGGVMAVRAMKPAAGDDRLRREAWSNTMLWNAVVTDASGIYASGPRWAGNAGLQLARVKEGKATAFPNAAWNSWKPGQDAAGKFVNVNALHPDGRGGLWAVDSGSPSFGGDPLPGGAKMVHIALATGKILQVVHFPPEVAKPGSYVDDVRFHGDHAYLTDAGNPGLIVHDMRTGRARRVLDNDKSTVAPADRPIIVDGKILRGPDGAPLKVQSDPMELSPDGAWLYFGPLPGPWSKVPTRVLDDASLSPEQVSAAVEPFADLPPMGGSTIDADGSLYFSDLKANAIRKRWPDGRITTLIEDPRLHWVDAMFIDARGRLWMPAAQVDRVALFQGGKSRVEWPVALYSYPLR